MKKLEKNIYLKKITMHVCGGACRCMKNPLTDGQ